MKKMLFGALMLAVAFTACKKKDSPSVTERVQHKWKLDRDIYHEYYSGMHTRDTTVGTSNDYAEFKTDGSFALVVPSMSYSASGTYSILNDSKIAFTYSSGEKDTSEIKTITDNKLVLYWYEADGEDYYEETTEMSR